MVVVAVQIFAVVVVVGALSAAWKLHSRRRVRVRRDRNDGADRSAPRLKRVLDYTEQDGGSEGHRCPLCARRYHPNIHFCPVDGTHLIRWQSTAPPFVCPTCQRAYPDGIARCPHDFDDLMPQGYMKANIKMASQAPPPVARVCPRCDRQYAPNQAFCQEDGTKLLVLN